MCYYFIGSTTYLDFEYVEDCEGCNQPFNKEIAKVMCTVMNTIKYIKLSKV